MKKIISILTAMLLVIALLPTGVFAEGETPANWINDADTRWYDESKSEFNISTPKQLAGIAKLIDDGTNFASKTINLTADIDLNPGITFTKDGAQGGTPKEWTAIGTRDNIFKGNFNGNGHKISGVYINQPQKDFLGFFGIVDSEITNIGIVNSYIKGNFSVGGVCGNNNNKIENSYNTGSVSGEQCIGGVCGCNEGRIQNCYNTGSVSGEEYIGGVCGDNGGNNIIDNCYNTGSVSGEEYISGVCGVNHNTIKNCYNTGSVSCVENAGGVCSASHSGLLINCYYSTDTIDNENVSDTENGLTSEQMQSKLFADTLGYHFKYDSAQNSGYPIFDLNKTINNKEDLITFRDVVNKGERCEGLTINLITDINLNPGITINKDGAESGTPEEWTTIGTEDNYFFGTFIGNNHTISGVYINQPDKDYQGFFGICTVGEIKNLGIINSYIKGKYYVGGVCGYNNYYATIENCYNTGSVSGTSYVGGVCGYNSLSTMVNCYNTGFVTGTSYVGGVCGDNDEGTIENCYYRNDIDGITENAVGNTSIETVTGLTLTQMQSDDFADKFSADFRQTITFKNSDLNSKKYFGGIDEFTLTVPTKTGYTFDGWYDNENFTGNAVTEITTADTGNKTFYAKWTANKYDVTLNDNDATSCDKLESYIYNTGATLPIPTKTGYTFDGWYDNAEFAGDVITKISKTDIEGKEFYAKWTANKYDVTLNTDNATSCDALPNYTFNTGATLPIPTKTGYTFDGWYDNSEFTGDAITKITDTDIENKEFYAKWTAKKYGVTLNTDNATTCDALPNYTYNTGATLPIPTKTGYTFGGWYDNAEFTGDAITKISDTDIESKEFYAKWMKIYKMLDGENQSWTQGSKDGLTFRSEADFSNFENVTVNDTILDENNYTKKSGSTIITLKPEYLETLSTGNYTIVINSTTGAATTTFEIKAKAITSSGLSNTKSSNPKTGNNIPISLMILTGFSLAGFVFTKKKKKYDA